MSNLINEIREDQKKQKAPWTILSDNSNKKEEIQPTLQEKKAKRESVVWKIKKGNYKVLPYIFTALTFLMVFIFSNQFKNMSADLFNSGWDGDTMRFGLELNNNFPSLEETNTGALVGDNWIENSTGATVSTWATVLEEDNTVITTAQEIDITPLEHTNNPEIITEENIQTETLPTENTHTSAPAEVTVTPVNVTPVTSTAETVFRVNPHTYDKVGQVKVTEDLEVLTLENLHNAASETNNNNSGDQAPTYNIPTAEQNVQSGPEEVLVFLISITLSTLSWFFFRKILSKTKF